MCSQATMSFLWDAMEMTRFPVPNWAREPGRSAGKSSRELARECSEFIFNRLGRRSKTEVKDNHDNNSAMFQIIFNELSAAEISALPKRLQLELLAEFQILPEDLDQLDSERFGVIQREGKKLYRYRANNYRIYFAKSDEGIKVHRVLHKNTVRDFLFRSKLPVSEDTRLGETHEFWKLIEEGELKPKA
jgi:mRNA-degrading endonuclease RelE of RelBE toxin-antitoxin system